MIVTSNRACGAQRHSLDYRNKRVAEMCMAPPPEAGYSLEEVLWDDDGTIEIKAKEAKHCVTLQLLHRIHTGD